jgi:hypothetical protein
LIADEIAICGTLAELPVVNLYEGRLLTRKTSILSTLQKAYLDAVRGIVPHPSIEMTLMPSTGSIQTKCDRVERRSGERSLELKLT